MTISGTPAVGQKLTAHPGTWSPTGTGLTYSWTLPNGTVIGTSPTLTVPASAAGQTVTLKVTGTKTGYSPATATATVKIAAAPYTGPTVKRIAGADRFATAVKISQDSYPKKGSAKVVFVASAENFPDALSAAPAAAKLGGPLLLTLHNSLPSNVAAEIKRLDPPKIVVVGGPVAVNESVVTALKKLGPTTRVGGVDRFATSQKINDYAFPGTVPQVFVASGVAFPDALSASAYSGAHGMPVVLVYGTNTSAPSSTVSWLKGKHISTLNIAGGPVAVTSGMQSSLEKAVGHKATRYGGADRFLTSALINAKFTSAGTAYLAAGSNFPDALSGAAAAGAAKAPLYVNRADCVEQSALDHFAKWKVGTVKVLGGSAVLGSNVTALKSCG